jgi:hypothetical protein
LLLLSSHPADVVSAPTSEQEADAAAAAAATTAAATPVAASAAAIPIPAEMTPDPTVISEQGSLVREVFTAYPYLDFMNTEASDAYAELAKNGDLAVRTGRTDPALAVHVLLQRIDAGMYLGGADGWSRLHADVITVTNNGEAFFRSRGDWAADDEVSTANRTDVS